MNILVSFAHLLALALLVAFLQATDQAFFTPLIEERRSMFGLWPFGQRHIQVLWLVRSQAHATDPEPASPQTKLYFSFMQDPSTDIWEALYAIIEAQSGYFSIGQAKECGYSDQLLRYHRNKGRFQSVLRGVYRMTHFPPTDHEDLIAIWLWSEMKGVFSHETALVLHQLSDSLPSNIYVTFPNSWKRRRLRYPDSVEPEFDDITKSERRWYGCVPVTTPARTIKDCRAAHVDPLLIDQAVAE